MQQCSIIFLYCVRLLAIAIVLSSGNFETLSTIVLLQIQQLSAIWLLIKEQEGTGVNAGHYAPTLL